MQENAPQKKPRKPLSWQVIAEMTKEEYEERRDEVQTWLLRHVPKRDQKVTSTVDD